MLLTLGNVPHSIIRAGALDDGWRPFLMIPLLRLIMITLLIATALHVMLSGPTIMSFDLSLTVEIPF